MYAEHNTHMFTRGEHIFCTCAASTVALGEFFKNSRCMRHSNDTSTKPGIIILIFILRGPTTEACVLFLIPRTRVKKFGSWAVGRLEKKDLSEQQEWNGNVHG